ncbi:uncharacterized protein TNCV_388961 [Trichonephila clavipes]|nr:uncharacterized protein TNCV_388961 [Trichonephila clavipes]
MPPENVMRMERGLHGRITLNADHSTKRTNLLSFYFDLCVFDNAEQKVCYFRVISARKTTIRLLDVPRQTVSDAICYFNELGNGGQRPESGRKCTVNTSKNHKAIEMRVQRNTRVSMRQIARDIGITDTSARRIAKTELGLKLYKLRKVQLLTYKNKLVQPRRCRKLLRRTASQRWDRFLFTAEKLFTVQQVHTSENDRIWSMDAPGTSTIVKNHQYPKSVIVWGGICASGKTPLVLVEEGVKIIQKV